jgi:transposase
MAYRPLSREQTWLLPPTLEELVPADHPARFVGAFVDALSRADWQALGVGPDGELLGAPAYHPRALLGVWLYGFMSGVRSARKLEGACRDQLPYLWLTGWQRPDHNTLWRFYQAHRAGLRPLLKRTVQTAVRLGLVDLAVQAVDGTKVGGNAARERTYDAAGLERLLERTEAAITDLEAQNTTSGEGESPHLPPALQAKQALAAQVRTALAAVQADAAGARVNLTDGEAVLLKTRQGYVAGYNAQAMVAPLAPGAAGGTGLMITAADGTTDANDSHQLLPLLAAAAANLEQRAAATLADGSYESGANVAACAAAGEALYTPAGPRREPGPYHKDRFRYDAASDTYTCPEDQVLRYRGETQRPGEPPLRVYRAETAVCRACPAYAACVKSRRGGRVLERGPYDAAFQAHRAQMATPAARARYRQRKQLPEPAFGIVKEQQGGRRFLLRGLAAVQAEWSLLATAFNLRTLWRVWARRAIGQAGRAQPAGAW